MFCSIKKITSSIVIICTCNFYLGCGMDSNIIKSDKVKEIKIGVTIFDKQDPFINSIAEHIEKMAKNKSSNEYKVTVNVADGNRSSIIQDAQVDTFIDQDYDVICMSMFDRTMASAIIDKCKKADKPIVFFNSEPVEEDMKLWDKVYYVGTKSEEAGEMQADIIIDSYINDMRKIDKNNDGKIQYVMLEGDPEHQDTLIRTECCIKTLINNGVQIEKLADDTANWKRENAYKKMINWVNEYGDKIEVVVSNNDEMALGVVKALEDSNISEENKPIIVGTDGIREALESIKNGNIIGTVFNDYKSQASYIFDIAYTLSIEGDMNSIDKLENNKYMRSSHSKVTKENVEEFLEYTSE